MLFMLIGKQIIFEISDFKENRFLLENYCSPTILVYCKKRNWKVSTVPKIVKAIDLVLLVRDPLRHIYKSITSKSGFF